METMNNENGPQANDAVEVQLSPINNEAGLEKPEAKNNAPMTLSLEGHQENEAAAFAVGQLIKVDGRSSIRIICLFCAASIRTETRKSANWSADMDSSCLSIEHLMYGIAFVIAFFIVIGIYAIATRQWITFLVFIVLFIFGLIFTLTLNHYST